MSVPTATAPERVRLVNGLWLDNLAGPADCLERIARARDAGQTFVVNYLYWSNYVVSRQDASYRSALGDSDLILPDGIGLQMYVRILLNRELRNLNGTDLNPVLLQGLRGTGAPIALYGATETSIARCVAALSRRDVAIDHFQHGYAELDWRAVADGAVLLVGLGSPKQEVWIREHSATIRRKRLIVMGVGGFFDYFGGYRRRAPAFVRRLRSEWIWNLLREPRANARKYLRNPYLLPYLLSDYRRMRKLNP